MHDPEPLKIDKYLCSAWAIIALTFIVVALSGCVTGKVAKPALSLINFSDQSGDAKFTAKRNGSIIGRTRTVFAPDGTAHEGLLTIGRSQKETHFETTNIDAAAFQYFEDGGFNVQSNTDINTHGQGEVIMTVAGLEFAFLGHLSHEVGGVLTGAINAFAPILGQAMQAKYGMEQAKVVAKRMKQQEFMDLFGKWHEDHAADLGALLDGAATK
jgi:hypothetical protein